MGHEDRELVRRLLRGDERAFERFFAESYPRLFRFSLARTGRDEGAAEEVAQATLCIAISNLSSYRGEAALFTWLCALCRNEIAAYYRRRRRQPLPASLVEDGIEEAGALDSLWVVFDGGPERALLRKDLARLVRVALDRLPERYGAALEWKYLESRPVQEIAARLGVSPKAAESLLTRAREAFRDAFETLARGGRPAGRPAAEGS